MDLLSLDDRVRHLVANAIEKSTSRGYSTGIRNYLSFCLQHSVSTEPTPQTLARYIAYTSLHIRSGPKYLTGARHFLRSLYPEFDKNREDPLVQAVIRGSKKLRADPVRRKKPLTTDHLRAFLQRANNSHDYDDLLFITILSCCFYACHCSGELVQRNNASLLDWHKIIKRASLTFHDGRAEYHLPYHKSDQFYQGTNVLFTPQLIADPVTLLRCYTSQRDTIHPFRPALFVRKDGSHPTRAWFNHHLFSILNRDFGGHSARTGGATFHASLGLSEDVIQAIGRWSSQAWKIYIRENPSVRAEQQLAHIRLHYNTHS